MGTNPGNQTSTQFPEVLAVTGTARHTGSTITSPRTSEVDGGFREEVAPEGVLGSAEDMEAAGGVLSLFWAASPKCHREEA